MRSKMKKAARLIVVAKYNILPTDIDDNDKYEREICANVMTLLKDGAFLWDGIDENVGSLKLTVWLLTEMVYQGRTNNLASDAIGAFCISYFYKGENALAKAFPDLFSDAVPEGAVALAATAVCNP